ncbi:helix-turn-helix transcriptional regulator [Curtobacterium sp. AB451]|uniref:helix-turn-helix transcriptional regulator n=1 Tax=Curtobacterium sp. AB451 TaxID=3422306 RepID=UPI003D339354
MGFQIEQRERLLTSQEVAEWVGMTPSALSQLRYRGSGPKFRKLGPKTVRYAASDVQAWIDAAGQTQTGELQEVG